MTVPAWNDLSDDEKRAHNKLVAELAVRIGHAETEIKDLDAWIAKNDSGIRLNGETLSDRDIRLKRVDLEALYKEQDSLLGKYASDVYERDRS